MRNAKTTQTAAMMTMTTVSTTRKSLPCGESVFGMNRADRTLLAVVVAAGLLALIVAVGAISLFVLSRRQDDRVSQLHRNVARLERANGALVASLARGRARSRRS